MENVVKYYRIIIEDCLEENPDMRIVVLPVSPVRNKSTAKNYILKRYNKQLRLMAEELEVDYYDYTKELSAADGQLKKEYAEPDGMHWKYEGCIKFRDLLYEYETEELKLKIKTD